MNDSTNALSQLIEKHVNTLKSNGSEVIEALNAAPPDLAKAQAVSHMIKGAAGSIGFANYAEAAMHLEKHLKALIKADLPADDQTFQYLDVFSILREALEPSQSSLY